MSDTFDHELEAFERWENGERDGEPDIEFTHNDVKKEQGFGKCSDCVWYGDLQGCNVLRDSHKCLINKRLRKVK